MTLRGASGKFSLPGFGRKGKDNSPATSDLPSPTGTSRNVSSSYSAGSPRATRPSDSETIASGRPDTFFSSHSGGTGGYVGTGSGIAANSGLDLLGKKIGKSIAHTSLLPALGNQDLRELQDLISSEKSVVHATERLALEVQSSAAKLPAYAQSQHDAPDLRDIMGHSRTLLDQFSAALRQFAVHEGNMRACYKRIREREEALDEKRRRRRGLAAKADAAERKLQKMGPENKQLVAQNEYLDSLRNEIRLLDSDLISMERKLGDFKRQSVKEALGYKFGGLEELGEKMCIIGELGKLLIKEIPLEETPPGYGRAPYNGHESTEQTVNEALKCLQNVHFEADSTAPRPPMLPQSDSIRRTNRDPQYFASSNEEVGQGQSAEPQSPGSVRTAQAHQQADQPSAERLSEFGVSTGWQPGQSSELEHAYEYEQQRQIDQQREANDANGAEGESVAASTDSSDSTASWRPLNVRQSRDMGVRLQDPGQDSAVSTLSPHLTFQPDAFAPLSDFLSPNATGVSKPGQLSPASVTDPRASTSTPGYFTPENGPVDENNVDDRAATPKVGSPAAPSGLNNAAMPSTNVHFGGADTPVAHNPLPKTPPESPDAQLAYDPSSVSPPVMTDSTPTGVEEVAHVVSISAGPGQGAPVPVPVSSHDYRIPRLASETDVLNERNESHDSLAARSSLQSVDPGRLTMSSFGNDRDPSRLTMGTVSSFGNDRDPSRYTIGSMSDRDPARLTIGTVSSFGHDADFFNRDSIPPLPTQPVNYDAASTTVPPVPEKVTDDRNGGGMISSHEPETQTIPALAGDRDARQPGMVSAAAFRRGVKGRHSDLESHHSRESSVLQGVGINSPGNGHGTILGDDNRSSIGPAPNEPLPNTPLTPYTTDVRYSPDGSPGGIQRLPPLPSPSLPGSYSPNTQRPLPAPPGSSNPGVPLSPPSNVYTPQIPRAHDSAPPAPQSHMSPSPPEYSEVASLR